MKLKSSQRYLIIYFIIIVLFAVSLNLYFIEKERNNLNIKKQEFKKDFLLQKDILEHSLSQMFESTFMQRKLIERYLSAPDLEDNLSDIKYSLDYSQEKGVYFLRIESGQETGKIVIENGDVFGNNIRNIKNNQKMKKLANSLLIQHLLLKEKDFVEWSVFYTPEYLGVVPGVNKEYVKSPGEVFKKIDSSLQKLKKDNNESIYQNGWETSIFKDNSKSFFMFSKNLPVKIRDKYIGIISANIKIDNLDRYINNNQKYEVYITNTYNDLVYINGEGFDEVIKVNEFFSETLRAKFNFNNDSNIIEFKDNLYMSANMYESKHRGKNQTSAYSG